MTKTSANAVKPHSSISNVPGIHCIGNLQSSNKQLLSDYQHFKLFVEEQILFFSLNKVGEVYHNFENGGFTAVVCLSESHLSIHTWPERDYLTFDIFLSNFLKDNRKTTEDIYQNTIQFFEAMVLEEQIINR